MEKSYIESPYPSGGPIPPQSFFGREEIFAQICAMFRNDNQRDSLLIYGEHGYGKSSIVGNAKHFCQLGEDTGVAVLNLQGVTWSNGKADLCYEIAIELWDALDTAIVEPKDDFQSKPLAVLRLFLTALHQAHPERRYILILDEYELLHWELPETFVRNLITLLSSLPWLSLTLVGVHRLSDHATYYQDICHWHHIHIGPLDADDVAKILRTRADDFPLRYSSEANTLAHQLTGGKPRLVQLLGTRIVQHKNRLSTTSRSNIVTTADIWAVINNHQDFA